MGSGRVSNSVIRNGPGSLDEDIAAVRQVIGEGNKFFIQQEGNDEENMKHEGFDQLKVNVYGNEIVYYTAGQTGSPLVLLQGGGVDSALISWGEMIPMLANGHRVIAPDLPGYGQSAKPKTEYSQEYYLDFLEKFLNALHLDKVSLAGLSLGGGISLGFTLENPERVDKLILVDSGGIMSHSPYHKITYLYVMSPLNELSFWFYKANPKLAREFLKAAIYDEQYITDELVELILQEMNNPFAGKAFHSWQRSEYRWNGIKSDYTGRLGEIRTPTLILHGDHDVTVPVFWAERAHQAIPGSRYVLLKNRRHWALRDNPEEIVAIIQDFLAE